MDFFTEKERLRVYQRIAVNDECRTLQSVVQCTHAKSETQGEKNDEVNLPYKSVSASSFAA